jgi:hypothetical protein
MARRIAYFAIVLAFALSSFKLPLAFAQSTNINNSSQGLNVEISPLPIDIETKPGVPVSSNLRIRNSGSVSEKLKLSLKTFAAEGQDGQVTLKDPSPNNDFIKWVSFDKATFDAPPGQWQTIKMTISPPKNAAFGYYYAVQVELASPPKNQPGTAKLQGAVAIFVLLNVKAPGASRKIEVTSFSADHNTYEFLPAIFSVRVNNSGNVHAAPHGNIFIKRGSHQVASIPINLTEGQVLPNSNRVYSASWNDGFPAYVNITDDNGQPIKDAKGQVKRQLKWDFSKISHLRFGHYTASLVMVYNNGQSDVPITGTLSFWVIPWRLIGLVVLLVAGPALGVYIIMRHRFNRKLARARRGGGYHVKH